MKERILNNLEQIKEKNSDKEILAGFSEKEQEEIKKKQKILSSLAYFIGKDFRIPVELNEPGEGWHWDFKENKIRIDPKDLLEKPMDYLRFVISHEGGHRRVSRTEFIPLEEWNRPGFSFMMNVIEDPRDNNFVAENDPKFKREMELAYEQDLDLERKAKEKAREKLGYQPRFMRAGFEYIKQWFKWQKGEEYSLSEDLPVDVKEAVKKTLESAEDSWRRYPSRQEADDRKRGEENIKAYAKLSYEINRDEIWPEFQKLVEKDMEDQKMQELLQEMQAEKETGGGQDLPQEMKDKLTPEEQKELEEAIDRAIENAKEQVGKEGEGAEQENSRATAPIDIESLPDSLKQKIKDYLDGLPEEKKKELAEKAKAAIKSFEKDIGEELEGKLSDNPDKKAKREESGETGEEKEKTDKKSEPPKPYKESKEAKDYKDFIEKTLKKDANAYEEKRREVIDIINKLENELRAVFRARCERRWETGKKSGPRINIRRRITEVAKGVHPAESRAWQKRELPAGKDYAITLLVDLSGSMDGEKINETFKAVIVLNEVLNRLSIKTEILGFNDRIYEYQKYGEKMNKEIREKMGSMLEEVNDFSDTGKAKYNDDGWALEQASKRLSKQKAKEKFLIVLSDGLPVESSMHPRSEYELSQIVEKILKETDQKLIGLGVGSGTEHVKEYYPNSIANVSAREMSEKLAGLIREVIVNYGKF